MEINHIKTTLEILDKIEAKITCFTHPIEPETIVDLDYADMHDMIPFIEETVGQKVKGDYLLLTA